jgi:ribosomal protein L16 Arg81 hydroxylase
MNALGIALRPYIPMAASTVLGAVGTLVTSWALKFKTRVELDAKKENAQIVLQSEPEKLLKEERDSLRAELAEVRAADRAERVALLKTLTAMELSQQKMTGTMENISRALDANSEKTRSEMEEIRNRLLVIETRLEKGA